MDYSLGRADLLHFDAFARQDPRHQNRPAHVVAQGFAAVDQLGGSKFEGRHGESRKWKVENRNWKIEIRDSKFVTRLSS
jgi:hypothetical protein